MTRVIPVPVRREIIERHRQGETLSEIAQCLSLSYWGVRQIWRVYRDQGESGLAIRYTDSGCRGVRGDRLIYRGALWLKRRHPKWGGGFIRVVLQQRYPDRRVPHARTLQRWFAQHQLQPLRPQHRRETCPRAHQVHQTWQLDATSHLRLQDGAPVSWLSLSDEYSGGLLQSIAFPPIRL